MTIITPQSSTTLSPLPKKELSQDVQNILASTSKPAENSRWRKFLYSSPLFALNVGVNSGSSVPPKRNNDSISFNSLTADSILSGIITELAVWDKKITLDDIKNSINVINAINALVGGVIGGASAMDGLETFKNNKAYSYSSAVGMALVSVLGPNIFPFLGKNKISADDVKMISDAIVLNVKEVYDLSDEEEEKLSHMICDRLSKKDRDIQEVSTEKETPEKKTWSQQLRATFSGNAHAIDPETLQDDIQEIYTTLAMRDDKEALSGDSAREVPKEEQDAMIKTILDERKRQAQPDNRKIMLSTLICFLSSAMVMASKSGFNYNEEDPVIASYLIITAGIFARAFTAAIAYSAGNKQFNAEAAPMLSAAFATVFSEFAAPKVQEMLDSSSIFQEKSVNNLGFIAIMMAVVMSGTYAIQYGINKCCPESSSENVSEEWKDLMKVKNPEDDSIPGVIPV